MNLTDLVHIGSLATAVIGAIRWLLGFYFKKAGELESLKAAQRTQAEQAIQSDINNLKGTITVFRQELNQLTMRLTEHAGQLRENAHILDLLQKQWERTSKSLEARYTELERSELIQVKENTFILKKRV